MEEAEWAIEVMKELGVPVACTMRVGPTGDFDDVSPGDCAVRMANTGKYYPCTGRARLIRSHSSAGISFELSGNMN